MGTLLLVITNRVQQHPLSPTLLRGVKIPNCARHPGQEELTALLISSWLSTMASTSPSAINTLSLLGDCTKNAITRFSSSVVTGFPTYLTSSAVNLLLCVYIICICIDMKKNTTGTTIDNTIILLWEMYKNKRMSDNEVDFV